MDEEQEQEILDYDEQPQSDQDMDNKAEGSKPEHVEEGGSGGHDPMSMPPHGTEVFISKVPREATDAQLLAFCEQCGHKVHAIRLPKDPGNPGQNKGYAFAVYTETEGANETLSKLNQAELSDFPGRKVTIVRSEVKNKLFIGNLPRELNKEQILEVLKGDVVGITDMNLMVEKENPSSSNVNRGFGFVEFYNNAAAEQARRKLSSSEYRFRAHTLTVTWAEPKKNDALQEQVKSIYVGNLPENVDESKLKSIFSAYGKISQIVLLKDPNDPSKLRNYGFVHYEERSSALKAIDEAAEGPKPELEGKELTVHMARPQPKDNDGDLPGRSGNSYGGGRGGGGYNSQSGGRGGGYNNRGGGMVGGGSGYGSRGGGGQGGISASYGSRGGAGSGARGGGASGYGASGGRGLGGGRGGAGGGRGGAGGGYGGRGAQVLYQSYEEGGYDDGYGGEEYGEDYEYGYGGGYGGYSTGMTMVPMMMPGGQVAYVMATGGGGGMGGSGGGGSVGGGGSQGRLIHQQEHSPVVPMRRSHAAPVREHGGPQESGRAPGGYGATGRSAAPPSAGRPAAGGYGGRGAAYSSASARGVGGGGFSAGYGSGSGRGGDYGEEYGNGGSRVVERERTYAEPRGTYSARAPAERPSAAYGGGEGRPVGRPSRYAPY